MLQSDVCLKITSRVKNWFPVKERSVLELFSLGTMDIPSDSVIS